MRRRALATLLALVALGLGVVAAALADGSAQTPTVSNITPTTAQVSAVVHPPGNVGSYYFEWGVDRTYGTKSDTIALGTQPGQRTVSGTIIGLRASTTYLVRVVVTGKGDPMVSDGAQFTTAPDPTAPVSTPVPAPEATAGTQLQPTETAQSSPPDPGQAQQGQAVVLGPQSGRVTVKQAGTDHFATVQAGTPVPVGSTVDATRGTVRLISQTTGNRTQDVVVRGGQFQVLQASGGSGITEFVLKGGNFASCRRASTAARRKKRPRRSLWASDSGGKFRTRGRNSVATVRGTTWRTTDTCSGTTTSVSSGSVVVRDLRTGRKYVVRKGQRHLARAHG